jgi:hypothetical protein
VSTVIVGAVMFACLSIYLFYPLLVFLFIGCFDLCFSMVEKKVNSRHLRSKVSKKVQLMQKNIYNNVDKNFEEQNGDIENLIIFDKKNNNNRNNNNIIKKEVEEDFVEINNSFQNFEFLSSKFDMEEKK